MSYIDTEGMQTAARRMNEAADNFTRAADRMEESVNRLTMLLGQGYGNNLEKIIQLLEEKETP